MSKMQFELVLKQELIPKVYFFVYKTDQEIDFISGQFFSLEIEPKNYRSYSTVYCGKNPPNYLPESQNLPTLSAGNYVAFMISTKPGGLASEYFEKIQVGSNLLAIGPNGKFALTKSENPKVFISTGTGLAPFVAMIEEEFLINANAEITVFFGVWKKSDNFAIRFLDKFLNTQAYPNFKLYTVIDMAEDGDTDENNFAGRVTTVIPTKIQDFKKTDFYLCGHPAMVTDMSQVLFDNGAGENVYMEKFGK